jgi:general secretion pathway protein J
MRQRSPTRRTAGFTLIELLIAVAILAMISALLFSAFAGMKTSKEAVERISDRYREGRLAMARINRDLSAAYISRNVPIDQSLQVVKTAFAGKSGSPADRVDFNTFANRRIDRDAHESDQAEVSYFGSRDPKKTGVIDLARRVSAHPDMEPARGGRVDVLATDIDLFDLAYLDPQTGEWTDSWDSAQSIGQPDRLPLQVRVILVLNDGARKGSGRGRDTIKLVAKIPVPIQNPIAFAPEVAPPSP